MIIYLIILITLIERLYLIQTYQKIPVYIIFSDILLLILAFINTTFFIIYLPIYNLGNIAFYLEFKKYNS